MTFKIFVSVCLILGCAFVVYGRPKAFPPNADTDGLAGLASLASFSPIRIISRFSDTKLDVNPKNAENLEDPPPIDVSKFSLTQWTAKKEIQPNNGTSANVIRVKRAEEKVSSQKKGKGKKKKKGKKRKKGRKRRKKKKKGSKKPEHEKKTKKPEIVKKKYPIKVEVGPVTTKKKKVKDITVKKEKLKKVKGDSKKVPKRIGLKKGKGHVDPKSANGKSILSRIIWALIKIIFVFMLIVFIIIHVIVHCIRARCKRMKLVARHKEDVKKGKSPPPVPSLMTVSNQLCGCGIEANDKDGVGSSKEIMEKTDNKKSKIDVKTEDTEKGKSKAKEAEKNESSSEEENEEEANEEEGQNEEEGENEEEGD